MDYVVKVEREYSRSDMEEKCVTTYKFASRLSALRKFINVCGSASECYPDATFCRVEAYRVGDKRILSYIGSCEPIHEDEKEV